MLINGPGNLIDVISSLKLNFEAVKGQEILTILQWVWVFFSQCAVTNITMYFQILLKKYIFNLWYNEIQKIVFKPIVDKF